jgi:hypothetical protein
MPAAQQRNRTGELVENFRFAATKRENSFAHSINAQQLGAHRELAPADIRRDSSKRLRRLAVDAERKVSQLVANEKHLP